MQVRTLPRRRAGLGSRSRHHRHSRRRALALRAVVSLQIRQEHRLANAAGPHPNILGVTAQWQDANHLYLAGARTRSRPRLRPSRFPRGRPPPPAAPMSARPRGWRRRQAFCEQGDLFDAVSRSPEGRLPEASAAQIMLQATMAVCACAERGIVHRDIKTENCVMDAHGVVKLMDFGLAIQATPVKKPVSRIGCARSPPAAGPRDAAAARRLTPADAAGAGACRTLEYMSPEVLALTGTHEARVARSSASGCGCYDGSVDVWALGCLAFELLTGATPFAATDERRTSANIAEVRVPLEALKSASLGARQFVTARRPRRPLLARVRPEPRRSRDRPSLLRLRRRACAWTPRSGSAHTRCCSCRG